MVVFHFYIELLKHDGVFTDIKMSSYWQVVEKWLMVCGGTIDGNEDTNLEQIFIIEDEASSFWTLCV